MSQHPHAIAADAGPGKAIDPVCGMTIDPATAAGSSDYMGMKVYFCSKSCKTKFDADPDKYMQHGGSAPMTHTPAAASGRGKVLDPVCGDDAGRCDLDDLLGLLAGARIGLRPEAVEGRKVFDELLGVAVAEQVPLLAVTIGALEDVVVDVGHVIELYSDFTQKGRNYSPFPDSRTHRIKLADLANPDLRERLHLLARDVPLRARVEPVAALALDPDHRALALDETVGVGRAFEHGMDALRRGQSQSGVGARARVDHRGTRAASPRSHRHALHHGRQHGGDRIGGIAEDLSEHASPHDLVDQTRRPGKEETQETKSNRY